MSYIRVVQHPPRSLRWWYEQALSGKLDMAPIYQRRSDIWSRQKKAHLIDSLINDFDIPKIYVADFTSARSPLNTKKVPYAIVDGKQRLEAVFAFFNDELVLNRSSLWLEQPHVDIKQMCFSDLRQQFPELSAKIESFEPVVMSIATDDEAKIYEMFVRLNSGEAANSAEKRNARPGPIPEMVRQLTSLPFFTNRVRFTRRRMQEFNLAAKLLLLESKGGFVDTKASNLDKFVESAAEEVQRASVRQRAEVLKPYGELQQATTEVLEAMAEAFVEADPLLAKAGNIPVYYWVVRNHPEVVDNLRDFLLSFEGKVMDAMRASKQGSHVDQKLVTYYTHARTTNDQQSLRGRYSILVDELRKRKLIGP
jgi:hypothetical protein